MDQGLAMGPLSTPDLVHFSGQVFVTYYVFSIFMETMWATQWWSSLLLWIKEDASPSHGQGCFEYTNPVPACSIAPEGKPALFSGSMEPFPSREHRLSADNIVTDS